MAARKTLSPRQQAFVDAYLETGEVVESARRAGYSKPHPQGSQLLQTPTIKAAIAERMEHITSARIATSRERQEFWTAVMRGDPGYEAEMKDRIKASELLGKTQGDFANDASVTTINNVWITPETLQRIREVVYGLAAP